MISYGLWVRDAIDNGWWDDRKMLSSYADDVARDAKDAHYSFREEIENDLLLLRNRIEELGKSTIYNNN